MTDIDQKANKTAHQKENMLQVYITIWILAIYGIGYFFFT